MVNAADIREIVDLHQEWLLIRELGRTFPLERHEIEIDEVAGRTRLSFLDEDGFRTWRLDAFEHAGGEITMELAGAFARGREKMRLVPRISARDLIAEVERARLEKANEIASLIRRSFPGVKVGRVGLNTENGRLAQIFFDDADRRSTAAISDITGKLTAETIFAAALPWLDKLSERKKPVKHLLVICEKRQAKSAQKLHALLTEFWKARITVVEIDRKEDPALLRELPARRIRELWREKAGRLTLPREPGPSDIAERIIELMPEAIDHVFSRRGETLRFNGLPFARVRAVMGAERAWFGTGRDISILTEESWPQLERLVGELAVHRSFSGPNRRHEYYRSAPEAWLESIFRRNIRLLDPNLILSPIYNQFRSSNDKIDLLALRRDGRLVIIELKTQPDRAAVLQSADYWRKIELQRRRGVLAAADLFGGREILDKPSLVYLVAPAWSFHREFEFFAAAISPEIELWRFELHQDWRREVRVLARIDHASGVMNR